jgi:hypothetical protein
MEGLCRDRYTELPVTLFRLVTCSMCYKYIFNYGSDLQPHSQQPWTLVSLTDSEVYTQNISIVADIRNATSRNLICHSLTEEECTKWTDCCYASISCCDEQLSSSKRNNSYKNYCPRTWDGYRCFKDTEPGSRTYFSCPSYVAHSDVSSKYVW